MGGVGKVARAHPGPTFINHNAVAKAEIIIADPSMTTAVICIRRPHFSEILNLEIDGAMNNKSTTLLTSDTKRSAWNKGPPDGSIKHKSHCCPKKLRGRNSLISHQPDYNNY